MEGGTSVASLSGASSTASWRERLPTFVGLGIVFGWVAIHLRGSDPSLLLERYGVQFHQLHGGGYWIDPESLGRATWRISLAFGLSWIVALALVLTVVLWERRPLASIGLRTPTVGDFVPALLALVGFYLVGHLGNWLGSLPNPLMGAITYALPLAVRLFAVSGVVCEEIMFRGYLIERLENLTRSTWVAAILSSLLFGLSHAAGRGFGYVPIVAAVGGVYAALYVWRRNLPTCMVVHFATDASVLWMPLAPEVWLPRLLHLF